MIAIQIKRKTLLVSHPSSTLNSSTRITYQLRHPLQEPIFLTLHPTHHSNMCIQIVWICPWCRTYNFNPYASVYDHSPMYICDTPSEHLDREHQLRICGHDNCENCMEGNNEYFGYHSLVQVCQDWANDRTHPRNGEPLAEDVAEFFGNLMLQEEEKSQGKDEKASATGRLPRVSE